MGLSKEQEAMIWDFYVTKSIAGSSSQKRTLSDYGLKNIPFEEMLTVAKIEEGHKFVLLADSINKTLQNNDLDVGKENAPIEIDVDTPRIVCLTPYSIADSDKPQGKVGEGQSVLTHIRNSFAHGNTYFFPNGNVLLEDKNRVITARILISLQTLLDWIPLIDKNQKFYVLHAPDETE